MAPHAERDMVGTNSQQLPQNISSNARTFLNVNPANVLNDGVYSNGFIYEGQNGNTTPDTGATGAKEPIAICGIGQ